MLELLSKNHSTWIAMGLSIGIPKHLVEDFVHELYLRFNKYIKDTRKMYKNVFNQFVSGTVSNMSTLIKKWDADGSLKNLLEFKKN
mgnify:CR=1 FL=1